LFCTYQQDKEVLNRWEMDRGMKKVVFLVIGCICLALGTVGVILPILPTTPFYLVTAYCFARSFL